MREKILRDPVHDIIAVQDPLLLHLIDTPEFQRLRRLRQLGTAAGTYHGAEHSRFGHSLGAMHIMGKVLARLRQSAHLRIDEQLERLAKTAALLHDIGHGPFSHGLERVLTPTLGHEQWTRAILEGPTAVRQLLEEEDPALPGRIVGLLQGMVPGDLRWLHHLVASQLDVDRMDYLLRDALYTGAFYGRFDLERLISTLTWAQGQVVFSYKGIPTAEEYVLARHYMYWQVYFHKTTRAQDLVLRAAWDRARELWAAGRLEAGRDVPDALVPFFEGRPDLGEYLSVDDVDVFFALKTWARHPDPILSDMASRFLHRRLLKPVFRQARPAIDPECLRQARQVVAGKGWNPHYYCLVDRTSDVAYDFYTEGGEPPAKAPIYALDEFGRLQEISRMSAIIRTVATRPRSAMNLYVPEECRQAVADRILADER
ncbi:HD domain-containing protein [Carboxydochorda subterranea]|uniref:HD domain-containing protein n=1 Tax=Carboxydichorda subterranea TaxID=3109565 RepID=A0ABZ1BYP1_9FIRM|nr:HD domain-containing protein [Limnochorda sp. L945t]WRP17854.1 HD domain-containing protein [Limnochorda sp. L945t]